MNYGQVAAALTLGVVTTTCAYASRSEIHSALKHAAQPRCTSTPCANTVTGEDPQDIAARKGQRKLEAFATTDSDKKRWKLSLYSTQTSSKLLGLDIIKAAGFRMRLLPEKGHLRFERGGMVDVFQIEQPINSQRTLCPEYTITVIDASDAHAIIRKACLEYEYKPGRYVAGAAFYLYDIASHTMRSFMESQTAIKDDPLPVPTTKPTVVKLKDGFDIHWKASFPANGDITNLSINNRYQRAPAPGKAGKLELVCSDLSAPKEERVEAGSCEGAGVPLVSSSSG